MSPDATSMSSLSPLMQGLVTLLSASMFLICIVGKWPQLFNILHTGRTDGISVSSLLLELAGYSLDMSYHCAMGYPFLTWGEKVILVFFDLVLIATIQHTRRLLRASTVLLFLTLYSATFVPVALNLLPLQVMYGVVALEGPVLTWSKLDQLLTIVRSGHAGSLSLFTWLMKVWGSSVRIFTTVIVNHDRLVLVEKAATWMLNVAVAACIVWFRYIRGRNPPPRRNSR